MSGQTGARPWSRWSLPGIAIFLLSLRLVVLLDGTVGFSATEFLHTPVLLLQFWQALSYSLTFEVIVLAACALVGRAGIIGRWMARLAVLSLLIVNLAGTVFFRHFHTYLCAFHLTMAPIFDSREMIASQASAGFVGGVLAAIALAIAFDPRTLPPARPLRVTERAGTLVVVGLSCYAVVRLLAHPEAAPLTAQSPVALILFARDPAEVHLPAGEPTPQDWAGPVGLAPAWKSLEQAPRHFNVVLVVMESVRADVVWPAPGAAPMPNLASLEHSSAVFTRAYAHEPRSRKGLEALLFGLYPTPTWDTLRNLRNDTPFDSVPERWSKLSHRSAMLMQWNPSYDGVGGLVAGRGMSIRGLEDLKSFAPAGNDRALVPALDAFIGEAPANPFAAVLWTRVTHLPYELPDGRGVPAPNTFEAYKATVSETDGMLGDLVAMLKRRGVLDDTVIVVTGDHGESFNERPGSGIGHGRRLYEVSVHVPLIFINSRLFHGERDDRIVQQMDVAPTLAWLAGDPNPRLNVGTAVFFEKPSATAYLLNPFDGYSGAIISGRLKYVWSESPGDFTPEELLFDLAADPTEAHNLFAERRADAGPLRRRLFGWYDLWLGRWENTVKLPANASRADVNKALLGTGG